MIQVDKSAKLPIYIQIYRSIRSEIIQGTRKGGENIESVRTLANELNLSKNTILKAYHQLLKEGFIENHPKSGYTVVDIQKYMSAPKLRKSFSNAKNPDSDKNRNLPEKTFRTYRYDFTYHKMPPELFSERKWQKYFNDALLSYDAEKFSMYCDPNGEPKLRNEIRRYLELSRNIKCSAEQIVICSGLQESIEKICRIIPSDTAVLECPGLPFWKDILKAHGFHTVSIPVYPENHFIENLMPIHADIVITSPSHQFPVGYTLSLKERLHLLDWAQNTGGILVEDDYDCEFRYSSQPLSAMKSMDHSDSVLYIGTFSKVLLPGLRVNYMVLPCSLLETHNQIYGSYPPSVPWITQKALYYFMNQEDFWRHILKARKLFKKKYQVLTDSCRTSFGNSAELIGTDAGLHTLLKIKNASDEKELIRRAANAGVKVYSIKDYWGDMPGCPENLVLLGFSYIKLEDISVGISLLAKAWSDFL